MAYQPKSYRKFAATTATAAMVASAVAPVASLAAGFTDVAPQYKDAVDFLVSTGATNGKTETQFGVYEEITRLDAAVILAKVLKLDVDNAKDAGFTDVPSDRAKYVNALVEADVLNGKSDSKFGAYDKLTRVEMAKIIANAYKLEAKNDAALPFTDVNATWAPFVKALYDNGVTSGKTETSFGAYQNITRGDFAQFVYRAANLDVAPEVVSVSAINAKQIEIKFNTKMDKDSVTDVTKYSIKRAGVPAVKLSDVSSANEYATAELSEDGKTLTITFKNALTTPLWGSIAEGDTFNFETAKLKAANGKEIDAASYAVKYSDKVAPVFVSAKAVAKTTTNKITLTFSEPIDYSVATVSVDGVFGSLSAGSKPNELVVTTNANLEVGKTYNLQILNVKDVAGNLLTPNPVNTTVTVTSDTAAPVVTDVKVVRDNLIEVTFDKSMDASTLTANGTVKLMDANFSNTNAISSVTPKDNTDNKVFLVALNPVSFNDNGNFLGTLVISDSAKDSLGNAIATTTKAVSLVKDTVKPQAISVKYVKATTYGDQTGLTNGALVVKFSEEIQTSTGSIVVVDDQGQTISVGSPVVNGKDKTELIIPLTDPVAQTAKFYTVSVSAGTVKDLSSQQNSNALATLTADVSAGAVTGKDTAAPSIASISGVAAVKTTSTGNQITFTIQDQANAGETASGVDFTTVTDVNNYRLDGAPLPSGSYVKVTGSDPSYTVTIQLPFGAISKDKNYSLNINGIKDKAGNVITPVAVNNVELKDDVQPELKTATLNANGTVSLGFSEDVVPVATASSAVLDFTVELNGSTLTKPAASPATDLAYELIDGTGADAGKYVLRVKVSKETQTVTDAATGITINGVKYTVDNDDDNLLFKFIDVNGNKTADNGDIILSATDVDSTTQSF
ncbi:S-layer homology domain-containing protein, partial [Geobacillus thermodenitrificans]|uniref:S-layer homology domain-containing protein n=1 Tax=Geobacillus thermodenitrificans TaxID=33940 RepID=UPI002E1DC2BA|nr:S-layer homology domain-containing protein [Geobacillus thermodenitrificans]